MCVCVFMLQKSINQFKNYGKKISVFQNGMRKRKYNEKSEDAQSNCTKSNNNKNNKNPSIGKKVRKILQ